MRWFHKPREKQRRLSALWNYNNSVLAFNKQVFIDTWTSYYFSQEHPDLEMVASQDLGLPPDLARALLMVAQARQGSKPLSPEDKLAVFTASLLFEQDNVAQPVKELCEELDSGLRSLDPKRLLSGPRERRCLNANIHTPLSF